MVETRIACRYRVMKAAKIEFSGGTIDCTVRDLSVRPISPGARSLSESLVKDPRSASFLLFGRGIARQRSGTDGSFDLIPPNPSTQALPDVASASVVRDGLFMGAAYRRFAITEFAIATAGRGLSTLVTQADVNRSKLYFRMCQKRTTTTIIMTSLTDWGS
jgi:hypothetical protein